MLTPPVPFRLLPPVSGILFPTPSSSSSSSSSTATSSSSLLSRDFPIDPRLKISRDDRGFWNNTQISELLNKALDHYDEFVGEFAALKRHAMALPAAFQSSVHRYFANGTAPLPHL